MNQQNRDPARQPSGASEGGFFSPVGRRPVFDPAAAHRRSVAAGEESPEVARKRRQARRRTINRSVGAGLVVILAAVAWFGWRPVWAKASDFVQTNMVKEMNDVAQAEQNYHSLYGYFTTDRSVLTLTDDGFNDVRVVSANSRSFCLAGSSLINQKLFYTPAAGITPVACV